MILECGVEESETKVWHDNGETEQEYSRILEQQTQNTPNAMPWSIWKRKGITEIWSPQVTDLILQVQNSNTNLHLINYLG